MVYHQDGSQYEVGGQHAAKHQFHIQPSGTPRRWRKIEVFAVGTADDFVEGSFFCFAVNNTTGGNHGEMNGQLFLLWLTTQLLPILEQPSILVMDNVPYHSILTD